MIPISLQNIDKELNLVNPYHERNLAIITFCSFCLDSKLLLLKMHILYSEIRDGFETDIRSNMDGYWHYPYPIQIQIFEPISDPNSKITSTLITISQNPCLIHVQ